MILTEDKNTKPNIMNIKYSNYWDYLLKVQLFVKIFWSFLKDCLCKLSVSGRFIKWNSNRFLVDCDHAHEKEIYPIELIRDNLDLIIRRNWFSSNYRQKFSMIYQFRVLTCSAVIISAIYNFPPSSGWDHQNGWLHFWE